MTALTDIRSALAAAPAVADGRERCVLAGASAQRAIWAEERHLQHSPDPRIEGAPIVPSMEFQGWTIRDVDAGGGWHDIEWPL